MAGPGQKKGTRKGFAIGAGIGVVAIIAAVFALSGLGGRAADQTDEAEVLRLLNAHIWIASNGTTSVAGFVVQNTGGKAALIDRITIKGQSVPTASWFYNANPSITTGYNIHKELRYDPTLDAVDVNGDGEEDRFIRASAQIALESGRAVFIYLENPAGIKTADSGQAVTIIVHSGSASAVQSVSVTNS
ncbi:MAG TPA: hypothetical protein VIB07_05245 [Nitrososphaera sp.]|jgi:hypothetical protein